MVSGSIPNMFGIVDNSKPGLLFPRLDPLFRVLDRPEGEPPVRVFRVHQVELKLYSYFTCPEGRCPLGSLSKGVFARRGKRGAGWFGDRSGRLAVSMWPFAYLKQRRARPSGICRDQQSARFAFSWTAWTSLGFVDRASRRSRWSWERWMTPTLVPLTTRRSWAPGASALRAISGDTPVNRGCQKLPSGGSGYGRRKVDCSPALR